MSAVESLGEGPLEHAAKTTTTAQVTRVASNVLSIAANLPAHEVSAADRRHRLDQ